jgi:hypothetical protein
VGKPEVITLIGTPRRRWMHNIKGVLTDIEWDGVGWVMFQGPVEVSCGHGNEPSGSIKNIRKFLSTASHEVSMKSVNFLFKVKKGKAIPGTDRGGL